MLLIFWWCSRFESSGCGYQHEWVQVTLEEQMICGALQTLNEEACEDVMEETEETGLAPPGTELGESVSSSVVDLCDEFDSPL
uniref:(California timema) hypothetical protein n=1 Tax=Timema californicum TaxID=61474 RepID=A0A7R9PA36_TIMCA|nr:unnamed protein product [Timema californicum]